MKRLFVSFLLVAGIALIGCGKPYTYDSYEVVRRLDRLQPGDDVRVVPLEGEAYKGVLVRVDGQRLTVSTTENRERTISWDQVRVIERIVRAEVR